jgi:hypothetical protein
VPLHINTDGWGPFVRSTIQSMQAGGYERVQLWLPSGSYHNPDGCPNFPPQFMDFLPGLAETDSALDLFASAGIELGFWWGRSTEIPMDLDAAGWNPMSCEDADYFNLLHRIFLNGQLQQARARGARVIGLDAFVNMPAWDRLLWVEDMQAQAPEVALFVHEWSGPDFLHAKIGNYYDPALWGRVTQPGPDLLSRYLGNGSSEIWVPFRSEDHQYTQQELQEAVRWGFTPAVFGGFGAFDVPALDYTLTACFDGLDNDGDGRVDFPYDSGCESAADDSE